MACRAVAHQSTHALVRRFIGKTSSKSSSSNNRRAMLSTSVLSFSSSTLVGGVNRIRTEHAIARLQNRKKNISTSTTIRAVGGSSSSAKTKQRYLCQECGEDYSQWYGQCPGCKAWDSMKIFREPISNANASKRGKSGGGAGAAAAQRAQSSSNNDAELKSSSSLIFNRNNNRRSTRC